MRILLGSLLCVTLFTCFSVAFAESQPSVYKPIVGVPGLSNSGGYTTQAYVNAIYKLSITIGALIAVVRIIFAGVEYMFDGVITHKSDAIKKIRGAIFGLLIILSAVLLLNTINPNLTTLSIFNNAPSIDPQNTTPTDSSIRQNIIKNNPVVGSVFSGAVSSPEHIAFIKQCLADGGIPAQSGATGNVECRHPSSCILESSCSTSETFIAQSTGSCGQCVPKGDAASNLQTQGQLFNYNTITANGSGKYRIKTSLLNSLQTDKVQQQFETSCLRVGIGSGSIKTATDPSDSTYTIYSCT